MNNGGLANIFAAYCKKLNSRHIFPTAIDSLGIEHFRIDDEPLLKGFWFHLEPETKTIVFTGPPEE